MTAHLKSCTRALAAGSTALLLAGTALAQAETAPATAADTTSNMMVVRDAVSGELRAPTALEARALSPDRGVPGARLNTLSRTHFSGARGARLSDQFMNHSVVARLADGSVVEQCFHTPEEAAIAHKVAAMTKTPAPAVTE
jgi:hypothetical protein